MADFDPNRADFSPYGFTCVRWNPKPTPRVDHHHELELNFLPSGSVTYLFGGQKVTLKEGRLTAFWAAIPHQVIKIETASAYFVGTIPFAWFLQFRLPADFVQRLFQGEVIVAPDTTQAGLDQARFEQWTADMDKPSPETLSIVALEFEARLRRLAAAIASVIATKTHLRPSLSELGLTNVERMACLIAQKYTERLPATDIAGAVGLHPVYAAALFKKTFGTTFVDYIAYHRVSHAQRLLATTQTSVVDVAFASGFNSISRFNDIFRRDCGCTPTEYRLRHTVTT